MTEEIPTRIKYLLILRMMGDLNVNLMYIIFSTPSYLRLELPKDETDPAAQKRIIKFFLRP